MKSKDWMEYFLPVYFVITLTCCTESSIEQEAGEILNKKVDTQNIGIQKSADGLQFIQENPNSNLEVSVGFSQEGYLAYEGDFKDGKPEGLWTTFFSDGKPRWKGVKKNGLNHGSFTMWYENGRKKLEGTYHEGKKHGPSIAWYENGAKWQQKFYEFGAPSGIWKTWDKNGNLTSELSHEPTREINATKSN
jgi:antitoxin component YwqK of YwqJK toxin-antitoxin module